MAESIVTLEELMRAYQRAIIAKVQLAEFDAWGETTIVHFKRSIEEHSALERRYLELVLERRREG